MILNDIEFIFCAESILAGDPCKDVDKESVYIVIVFSDLLYKYSTTT